MKGRLLLSVNPVSGKGRGKEKLFDIVEGFSSGGCTVTVLPTRPNGLAVDDIAREAAKYDFVVTVGGDGTLNQAINGILQSGTDVPLGYIPLGSTNDFASSLELNGGITECVNRILDGEPSGIDIGSFSDKRFVYIACTGVFTEASYSTSQQMKNALGHNAYILKALLTPSLNKKARMRIETDVETLCGDYVFMGVSNSLRAGGIFKMGNDDVSFDDGLFELTLAPAPDNIKNTTALINDILALGMSSKSLIRRQVHSCRVVCDVPQRWSLDGENGGETADVSISVERQAIYLIR